MVTEEGRDGVMVNFISPWLDHGTQIFSQTLFWSFCEDVLVEINIKISRLLIKKIFLPSVGEPHPIS